MLEILRSWLKSGTVISYLQNSFWMLTARALWILTALLVGIAVARKLGPADFGCLSYAVAYVGIFAVVTNLGLDVIINRELIQHPENQGRILGNYFMFKLLSIAVMLAALGISFLFHGDNRFITGCLLVAAGYALTPFCVVQCFFIATVKNHYHAWSQIICCLVYNAIRLTAVLSSASLEVYFAAEAVLVGFPFVLMFLFYWKFCDSPFKWSFRWNEVLKLLPAALPLSITVVLSLVYSRTDILMLNHYLGKESVGFYTIASRFTENLILFVQILGQIFSAAVISAYSISNAEYVKQLHRYYFLLFWISAPPILILLLIGRPLITFLYGEAFSASAPILYWHILSLPFNGLLTAFYCHAVNEHRLAVIAAVFCSGAVLNVPLNMLLIPWIGASGAAICSVAAMPVGMSLTLLCTSKGRRDLRFMIRSIVSLPSFRIGSASGEPKD